MYNYRGDTVPENNDSTVDFLVHQACDERARLLQAMQCSGTMFDTNMQCVSHILSLKKENSIQKRNFDREREVHICRVHRQSAYLPFFLMSALNTIYPPSC